jgi:DNA-binding MarR family transcriptional regulator
MAVPSPIEVTTLLRRAQLRKQAACENALNQQAGMTLAQWGMLHAIAVRPDSSTHALALFTGQSDQSAGAIVARLEQQGFVVRRSAGGKAILHAITPAGTEQVGRGDTIVTGVMDRLLAGLSDDDLRTLAACLTTIADAAAPPGAARGDRAGLSGTRPAIDA